jgi:hypothetical protein
MKEDLKKDFQDAHKVAGGALLGAKFMQKMSIALAKRGHMAIFISQVRADIKLDPYTKKDKNKILGHYAKITVKKSPNEKSNYTLQYPVRYGRTGGNSVWVEKELIEMLYGWEYVHKRGAWISADESFLELLKENGLDFPEKVQGEAKLSNLFEEDQKLTNFLTSYFKKIICE